MAVCGLATVDLSSLTGWQQALLLIQMCLGSPVRHFQWLSMVFSPAAQGVGVVGSGVRQKVSRGSACSRAALRAPTFDAHFSPRTDVNHVPGVCSGRGVKTSS